MLNLQNAKKFTELLIKLTNMFKSPYICKNGYVISLDIEEPYLVILDEEQMAKFYSQPNTNPYNLYINEYLIIQDINGEIVDKLLWTGESYRKISYEAFDS